ncbi:hypothetical protein [Paenibacillus sp. NPDC058174]|uniref:hypothetical protein n=1 Tax=Paenibacillus sp. NPDC058174 TaxID=3346366 RepID=UPI0036DA9B97
MSKKLEGNGRWESSRMMLPEHREQYLQRRAPQDIKPVPVPTKEELEFIRDFVLLPMMLSIVEKNLRDIELSSYTMKPLFIRASFAVVRLIENDLAAVRKELQMRKIQVFQDELESEGGAIHYRFVCRGYEDRFSMIREVARAQISIRIAKYIAKVCN